ncbi:MAG: DNA-directed RNA polymerase subunit alpha [Deltaproteobacteria bacterium]|nr:DNA-directed RNA polymerase subunit alpha [Deltaproteobacteria bacterium]
MHRNWKDLIKPRALEAEQVKERYGKFVAKPLERGYGMTLGNSLRRVLLSSINGAAVVAIRFEGVEHEFSTITGIKEDLTDIILNIKQLNLRFLGEKDAIIRLSAKGPKILTAKDIETSGDVEILNPEQVICTVNEEGKIHAEMIVRHGRGYVPAEKNKRKEIPIGFIAIDSIFAPVRRVAYSVQNARVGQDTDYDKLSIELWTNGAVRPDDAMAYAAKILKEQLTVFINFDEAEDIEDEVPEETEKPKLNEHLFKTVDELELSVRAANCLENANIKYIGELVTKSESEMLKTKNFGRKSLNEIKDILMEMGLSLGMKIDGFDPSTLRKPESDQETENP